MTDLPQPCAQDERSRYVLSRDPVTPAIMFIPCGYVSFNPNDVHERYCALCHRFIEDAFGDLPPAI